MALTVVVVGAEGRMGGLLVAGFAADPAFEVVARVDPSYAARSARSRPGAAYATLEAVPEETAPAVIVEFTTGAVPASLGPIVTRLGSAWISGTTGLTDASAAALRSASGTVPVLWSPNMSLGVALLRRLCGEAARLLPSGWEMEIVEAHHGAKVDAPSGTATALAEVWTRARGGSSIHGRSGRIGPRPPREVGIHSLRLPEGVGEHRLCIGGPAEQLELAHRALDRSAFVAGTLVAAKWLASRKPALYTLDDWVRDRLVGNG